MYASYTDGNTPEEVTLVTKDTSKTIQQIERDSMGRYYVIVPEELV